ncbi:MAG: hypothetical protein U9O53_03245, partial [archaeon]|nr:hypothetical protein [archaeon]
ITGIYAKHNELNYSTENLGLLESFIIPEQDKFKKNYTLQAELKAYRPWAWRLRLIKAISIIVNKKNLEIPGFPTDTSPQTIGDLYFSEDFLGGQAEYDEIDHTCNAEVMLTNTYDIDVLHNVPELSGNSMCTITDLSNHINTEGITQELTDYINTTYSLDTLKRIDNIEPKLPENRLVTYPIDTILLNVIDYGFTNNTEFINYISSTYSTDAEIFQYLRDENIITDESLLQKAKEQISSLINTDEIGCDNYEYQFTGYEATGNIVITKGEEFVEINTAEITATWINNIITDIEVEFTTEYDCESSWSWGNLADLNNETLAKCIYNWDECILNETAGTPARSWPYYEVADCGMGPPSGLMDTSLKDAARGSKTISTQVTIYKTCTDGTDWISSEKTHACINGSIYKCKFDLSNDVMTTGINVTRVDDGYIQISQKKVYICTEHGLWKKMGCDSDSSNSKDDGDQSCLNTGNIQGFCGAISGTYQWQENPDNSSDSCCCLSDGYWDDTNHCCDAGDSWTSTSGKWICQESVVKGYYDGNYCDSTLNPLPTDVVVTFECDEQEIDGTKKWWNGTDWVSPAPEFCGCTQTSDCDTTNNESCIENICVTIKEPILNFIPYSSISIMVGDTEEIMLDIRNDMNVTDHIEITIDKSQDISNWAWFKGQKSVNPHSRTINVKPESSKKVIIQILGGKTGSYNLKINSKSLLTLKEGSKEAQIRVIPKVDEDGNTVETTNTPGLSWLGFIATMIIGLFVFSRNDKF